MPMNDPFSFFERAIRATHGAKALWQSREFVDERLEDGAVWKGEVLVFQLLDHPTAKLCYAWEAGETITAVLHAGPVNSAVAAVRASISAGD